MTNAALMATRYARRPLLLTPDAAGELALRIRALDDRAFARPGRLQAFLRKVGLGGDAATAHGVRGPALAMEDYEDGPPPVPMEQRLAYSPRWAGEPEDVGYCWSLNQGVAMMCCDTPLVERGDEFCGMVFHGYDTLLMGMREALADARVNALFIRLDSPGGVVGGGLPQLAAFMRSARASAGGKPIWVYADMAASAAYWIASGADRISAPAVGIVGSIGAVWVHEDWSGFDAKAGIVITPVQFGSKKTDGAPWAPLSPGAKADVQADIDQLGRDFIADVVAGRPQLTSDRLLATEAACFMARHDDTTRSGLDLGFVDAIETEEEAFAALVEASRPAQSSSRTSPAPGMAAAGGGDRPTLATTEGRMAANVSRTALAVLTARHAALGAHIANLSAEPDGDPADKPAATAESDPCPACEGTGKVDGDTCTMCEGTGIDPNAGPGAETEQEPAEAAAPASSGDADAILASPEADAHPHLAMAAARTGQTLAQFKASVDAVGKAPKKGALAEMLAGARRLGADTAGGAAPDLGAMLLANAQRRAEAAAKTRH